MLKQVSRYDYVYMYYVLHLRNTEAELKKGVACKKMCRYFCIEDSTEP